MAAAAALEVVIVVVLPVEAGAVMIMQIISLLFLISYHNCNK